MTKKALSLFQFLLEIYVVYTVLNQQWLLPLLCLALILLVGRYESTLPTPAAKTQEESRDDQVIEIDLESRPFSHSAVQQH